MKNPPRFIKTPATSSCSNCFQRFLHSAPNHICIALTSSWIIFLLCLRTKCPILVFLSCIYIQELPLNSSWLWTLFLLLMALITWYIHDIGTWLFFVVVVVFFWVKKQRREVLSKSKEYNSWFQASQYVATWLISVSSFKKWCVWTKRSQSEMAMCLEFSCTVLCFHMLVVDLFLANHTFLILN